MKYERILWIIALAAVVTWSVISRESNIRELSTVAETKSHLRGTENLSAETPFPKRERLPRSASETVNLEARSMTVLQSEDQLARLGTFLRILDSADAGDLAQITRALQDLRSSGVSRPMEEELLNLRAGQLNGAALLTQRQGSAEDMAVIGDLKKQYEGWLQSQPEAAKSWLDALPAGKYRDQMAITFIATHAGDDPTESLSLVATLHSSQQAAAGKAAAGQLASSGVAEEFSRALDDMDASTTAGAKTYLASMLESLTSTAGENGTKLIENHLDKPYVTGSILARVSAEKAKSDPMKALQWAASMEGRKNDIPQGEMVASAISGVTLEGLPSAREWARSQEEGTSYWLALIEKREEYLIDHSGEENRYDKDD